MIVAPETARSGQRVGRRILDWLGRWFPRIVLGFVWLGPIIEFHGIATDFDTYEHLIGSDHMCSGSPAHCSWEAFLSFLASETLVGLIGVGILLFLRGRERELVIWQWTALLFVNSLAFTATSASKLLDE